VNTEHWLGLDNGDKLAGMAASEKISRYFGFGNLATRLLRILKNSCETMLLSVVFHLLAVHF